MQEFDTRLGNSLVFHYNVNANGEYTTVKIDETKQISPLQYMIQLSQNPDDSKVFKVIDKNKNELHRVYNMDEINAESYYLNAEKGQVYFDSSKGAENVVISYDGQGYELIGASRVYDETDCIGNTIKQTLQDIINKGREYIKAIELLGGAIPVITRLENDIADGMELYANLENDIEIAVPLQSSLHKDIQDANTFRIQFNKDVAEGKELYPKLHSDIAECKIVNNNLDMSLNNAKENINLIRSSGNPHFEILSSDWISNTDTSSTLGYMKDITHNLETQNIIINAFDITTGMEIFPNVRRINNNTLRFFNDNNTDGIKVILSARYYDGGSDIGDEVKSARKTFETIGKRFDNIDSQLADIVVNVKSFGAKGDGITDDTASVQNALNSEYNVYFPYGIYLVQGLTITDNKRIDIAEGTIIKQKTGYNKHLLSASNIDKFDLIGGTLDGNPSNISFNTLDILNVEKINIKTKVINSGRDGLKINNCGSGKIDVFIRETKLSGVNLTDSSNFDINVDIDGTDGSGVLVSPATKTIDNVHVRGIVKNCARTLNAGVGVYFASGDNYIVKNSSISARVYNAGWLGIFPGGDYNSCIDCIVDGSGVVTVAGGHGIRVHDSAHINLTNCFAYNSARAGISINKAHDVNIVGCQALNNKQHGFWLTYDTGITGRYQGDTTNKDVNIVGCTSNNNGTELANNYSGFYIDGYRNISLVGCQAHDYQSTKTQQRGIRANTNAFTSGISIHSCDFSSNIASIGILIDTTYLNHVNFKDGEGSKLGFYGKTGILKPSTYTVSNVTTDRTYDANATTIDEISDVLGTLITDLKNIGIIG